MDVEEDFACGLGTSTGTIVGPSFQPKKTSVDSAASSAYMPPFLPR